MGKILIFKKTFSISDVFNVMCSIFGIQYSYLFIHSKTLLFLPEGLVVVEEFVYRVEIELKVGTDRTVSKRGVLRILYQAGKKEQGRYSETDIFVLCLFCQASSFQKLSFMRYSSIHFRENFIIPSDEYSFHWFTIVFFPLTASVITIFP